MKKVVLFAMLFGLLFALPVAAEEGSVSVTAREEAYLPLVLNNQVCPLPDPVTLVPNGQYGIYQWDGTYADIDEGVDSHDSDTTYISADIAYRWATHRLEDYSGIANIAGIRIRQVWRAATADGFVTPCAIIRTEDYALFTGAPNGNGTNTAWTNDYLAVDDDPDAPDDDTTYISSSTVGHQESVTATPVDLAENALIWRVGLTTRGRKTTADAASYKRYIIVGGTRYYSNGTVNPTTNYVTGTEFWNVNPATEKPWTVRDFNNLEYGVEMVSCDGGEVRITLMSAVAQYVYKYPMGQVGDTYEERYVDIIKNPATDLAWTDAQLDSLIVGVYLTEEGSARVTAIDVKVYPRTIQNIE